MPPRYHGPSKHEILLLISNFNQHHPRSEHFQIQGLSECDVAKLFGLETLEKQQQSNYNSVQLLAISLMNDLQDIKNIQPGESLWSLSFRQISKKAKSFAKALDRSEWLFKRPSDKRAQDIKVESGKLEKGKIEKEDNKIKQTRNIAREVARDQGQRYGAVKPQQPIRMQQMKTRPPHSYLETSQQATKPPIKTKLSRENDRSKYGVSDGKDSKLQKTKPKIIIGSSENRRSDERKKSKAEQAREQALRLASEVGKF